MDAIKSLFTVSQMIAGMFLMSQLLSRPLFLKVTYIIELKTVFVLPQTTRRMPHIEQCMLTIQGHLRPRFVLGDFGCSVLSFLCYVLCTVLTVGLFLSHGVVSLFSTYNFECRYGIFRLFFKDRPVPDNNNNRGNTITCKVYKVHLCSNFFWWICIDLLRKNPF